VFIEKASPVTICYNWSTEAKALAVTQHLNSACLLISRSYWQDRIESASRGCVPVSPRGLATPSECGLSTTDDHLSTALRALFRLVRGELSGIWEVWLQIQPNRLISSHQLLLFLRPRFAEVKPESAVYNINIDGTLVACLSDRVFGLSSSGFYSSRKKRHADFDGK
jgi:hypothetical protein